MILRAVPKAKVTGNAGRRSSFEVKINGKLIFSKLTAGGFPKFENIVNEVFKA